MDSRKSQIPSMVVSQGSAESNSTSELDKKIHKTNIFSYPPPQISKREDCGYVNYGLYIYIFRKIGEDMRGKEDNCNEIKEYIKSGSGYESESGSEYSDKYKEKGEKRGEGTGLPLVHLSRQDSRKVNKESKNRNKSVCVGGMQPGYLIDKEIHHKSKRAKSKINFFTPHNYDNIQNKSIFTKPHLEPSKREGKKTTIKKVKFPDIGGTNISHKRISQPSNLLPPRPKLTRKSPPMQNPNMIKMPPATQENGLFITNKDTSKLSTPSSGYSKVIYIYIYILYS